MRGRMDEDRETSYLVNWKESPLLRYRILLGEVYEPRWNDVTMMTYTRIMEIEVPDTAALVFMCSANLLSLL